MSINQEFLDARKKEGDVGLQYGDLTFYLSKKLVKFFELQNVAELTKDQANAVLQIMSDPSRGLP
ncbi:MAG: hypothetical protein GY828_01520 [Candidatus Gracilibacteria bacterium]|nr:hypothetical protein [Candidatus Gracilibacteria bacterium]